MTLRIRCILKACILCLLCAPVSALAQDLEAASPTLVTGRVTAHADGGPLIGANVALRNARDSALVAGAVSQEDGRFRLEDISPGAYDVQVSYIGYQTKSIPGVTVGRRDEVVELDAIPLRQSSHALDEAVVSGERGYMEVQAGKVVYNIQERPIASGGSARNVLENLPSVAVSIEGNISLRGSENVAIHLNGQPAPMSGEALTSFLEGLSAVDIARVEVIANPSARYDPEGTSGIINIVLANNRDEGWGGAVSAGAGTRGGYDGSANLHYTGGAWNLFANYSLRYHEHGFNGERYLEQYRPAPGVAPLLEQETGSGHGGLSNTFNSEVKYQLSDENTISLSSVFSHHKMDRWKSTRYLRMAIDQAPLRRYRRGSDGKRTHFSMDHRLTFKRILQPRKHELTAETRYEENRGESGQSIAQRVVPTQEPGAEGTLADRQRTDEADNERTAVLQVDYRRPLGENMRVETGVKGELEWLHSTFYSESWNSAEEFAPDADLNNTFDYAEQIYAAYGILGGNLGSSNLQAGLRAERALTTFDQRTLNQTFENNYFSLFPSAHLSYKPSQGNTFELSYSKRVERPSIWQLNPFGSYDDPTFIWRGNSTLQPEYTHSLEGGYARLGNKYTLRFSPYFRHTTNAISRYEQTTPNGVTIITFDNFETQDSYGLELIGSLTLGKWLKGNVSFNTFKRVTDGTNLASELSSDAIGFRTRASVTSELGRGVRLQLSQFYRSPMEIPGGRIESYTRTNATIEKELFAGSGNLSLRVRDMFDTLGFEMKRDRENYYQVFSRKGNMRGLILSFRYNFGREDKQRRHRGNGDGEPGGDGGMGM